MLRNTILRLSTFDLAISLLVLAIFIVDLWTPLGIAVGLLYIIPVWLTAWSYRANFPAILSICCAVLTVLGAWVSPPGSSPLWYAIVNRAMSIFAILAGGYLAYRERVSRTKLAHEMAKRETTEAALREHELLNLALESARMGAWDFNVKEDSAVRTLRHDQIFGYDSLQPKWGRDIFMTHVVPEDREQAKKSIEEAYSTGQLKLECRITWPDQSIHWIAAQGRVHYNDNGEPIRIRGTIMDVTERKQTDNELQRTQQFLASIVENIPDMIFVKDARDLRFVLVNKAAEDLLGHTRAELIGKGAHDFFPRHEAETFTEQDREVLKYGKLLDIPEESMQTKHGSRTVHAKKIPIVDDQGRRQYLLGIARDITEKKRLEKERETLIEQLRASLAQITTLEGILPICAHCKRIRDEQGEWHAVESYVRLRSKAEFSHGICPICMEKHYPGHTPRPPSAT
jgi:PAS domain S-box-containing protein